MLESLLIIDIGVFIRLLPPSNFQLKSLTQIYLIFNVYFTVIWLEFCSRVLLLFAYFNGFVEKFSHSMLYKQCALSQIY